MSYNIRFSDQVNNDPLIVNDNTINTATSLGFPGRNQKGYAVTIAEDLLHLLENFSNTDSPSKPIKGQLWYDTTTTEQTLKVYNGTDWKPAGNLRKGSNKPINTVGIAGDLYVDTGNQQLYLHNGSSWISVGPTLSGGVNGRTGSIFESLTDASNPPVDHSVIINYVDGKEVSIISRDSFTPKKGIPGFSIIKQGINVNSGSYKLWGVSEKAESLIISNKAIPADSFLRSDVLNVLTEPLTIRNNTGITLGDNAQQFQMKVDSGSGVLYHSPSNSKLDLRVNVSGLETTLVTLDSATSNVGIGKGSFTLTDTLTVNGSGSFSTVKITSATDSLDKTTGSLLISGGIYIDKTLRVGGDIITSGQITSNSILPNADSLNTIGSSTLRYSKVYSNDFYGTFNGDVKGNITGTVVGSATKLASASTFAMRGDVSTDTDVVFDGSNTGSKIYFQTKISKDFIDSKTPTTATVDTDEIMIYRPNSLTYTTSTGTTITEDADVYKIVKSDFLKNLALVPVGSIFPFAGTADKVPDGYLLCDGSEKAQGKYQQLFQVIGLAYTYNQNNLVGSNTFRLPDLRGRFPLGLLNMDNNDQVADSQKVLHDSGGGDPTGEIPRSPRVTAGQASTIGTFAGYEQITLATNQLPDHNHKLSGSTNQTYYALNNNTTSPADANATLLPVGGTVPVQAISTTSGIQSTQTNQPINVTNPFLTINYIIYSGVYK